MKMLENDMNILESDKEKGKLFKLKTKKNIKDAEPIHKVKSKGVVHIVPQNMKCDSMVIDNKC